MRSVSRPKSPLNPVTVTGRFLQKPICCCEIVPGGKPGVLSIDGTPYLCSFLGELPPAPAEPVVYGYAITKHDGTVYHIDTNTRWGQWQCDCADATYRGERPGGCKHVAALRQALAQTATLDLSKDEDEREDLPVCRKLVEGSAA